MLGAIAGDIIGSVYERQPIKTTRFPLFSGGSRFTDDTVLTIAVADCLLSGEDYVDAFHRYFALYPNAGYGGAFFEWARSGVREPYGSYGNGSAMRVSPVGWAFDTMEEVLEEAGRTAQVTHDHPEGVVGAQATAAAILLARQGQSREEIRRFVEQRFDYDLSVSLDAIRPGYSFDVTCQGTVPPAIRAFLESEDYEDAVRKAISQGGDSDTLAAITGSIAHAFYGGVPEPIALQAASLLDDALRTVVEEFIFAYDIP